MFRISIWQKRIAMRLYIEYLGPKEVSDSSQIYEEGRKMSSQPETTRPPPTILIVDDEPFVLESVALLLDRFGYNVVTCD